ncbi:MAG: hypothetical protein SFZ24_12585 [Planctomycetota bacterium]|nr:hypothetical protein [Planctomycetota bacterium]
MAATGTQAPQTAGKTARNAPGRGPTAAALLALALAPALPGLPGCANYVNYPAIGTAEEDAAINDPNVAPAPTIVQAALRRVTSSFPVDGPYVINLPEGMTRRRAEEILRLLKDPDARLPAPDTLELPAYHVTRVWLRPADKANVEVLRPIFGVGARPGEGDSAQYQPVMVRLRRSPLEDWKVDSVRVWPIGTVVPPPLFGWDEPVADPSAVTAPAPPAAATPPTPGAVPPPGL